MSGEAEIGERFDCFGSSCVALVTGAGAARSAREATTMARRLLLAWHARFSRFLDTSELSRLNRSPHEEVRVSPLMARLAQSIVTAGSMTGGLVDATMVDQIESAGYLQDLPAPIPLEKALELAPARKPAAAGASAGWQQLEVNLERQTVWRPVAVKLDSGGLAKGMFADVLAEMLASHAGFAINCAGDVAIGGAEGLSRPVDVESPFDGRTLHTFELKRGGVATSGIGRRSWLDPSGRPAHHLLDPGTGRPAFTGIVQATALAPSALMAEIKAKAAILSGPRSAAAWLSQGGVIVFDDGSHQVIEPPPVVTLSQLSPHDRRIRRRLTEAEQNSTGMWLEPVLSA